MRRSDVIARLKQTEPELRSLGVGSLYLFGSHARDEAKADSDVDVFVEPVAGRTFDFISFMGAREAIESVVEANVDYGTRRGLHPLLRDEIERVAVRIF